MLNQTQGRRRYEGKVALVTAGASGIGRATVMGMAAEGARVVFSDINEAGKAVEEELRALGLEARFRSCDGTDDASVRELVAFTVREFGGLHVAVNNIGNFGKDDGPARTMGDTSHEIWTSTIHQSLTSCFLGMKYQIEHMIGAGGGVIANTSSLAALKIVDVSPAYTAAKAGVTHLTRYVAVHHAKHNIRCNVIAPGMTITPAFEKDHPDAATRNALAGTKQPIARMVEPREVADAFLWACSDDASMVTGQSIAVDGGWAAT